MGHGRNGRGLAALDSTLCPHRAPSKGVTDMSRKNRRKRTTPVVVDVQFGDEKLFNEVKNGMVTGVSFRGHATRRRTRISRLAVVAAIAALASVVVGKWVWQVTIPGVLLGLAAFCHAHSVPEGNGRSVAVALGAIIISLLAAVYWQIQ